MKNLRCYKVTCIDTEGNTYEVGVMTIDEFSAKHSAEHSLYEGRHIKAKAKDIIETNYI